MNERLASALAVRYHFERELGQGGMATVYLAQDLKHDRPVAIKVRKPELGAERFVQEIESSFNTQPFPGGDRVSLSGYLKQAIIAR